VIAQVVTWNDFGEGRSWSPPPIRLRDLGVIQNYAAILDPTFPYTTNDLTIACAFTTCAGNMRATTVINAE